MGLFDEIRKQIEEAMAEAQGERPASPRPRPRPQAQSPEPPARPPDAQLVFEEDADAARSAAPEVEQRVRPPVRKPPGAGKHKVSRRSAIRAVLKDRNQLRQAFLINELLGAPVSRRGRGGRSLLRSR